MSLKNIKYVIGIDFGAVSSGVSIARTEEPSVKYTVNEWEVNKEGEKGKPKIKGPKQFLTSILYKTGGIIICGLSNTASDKASRDKGDVYINNIKQYIQNIDQANEELEERMEGLTIQKVVTDYLKAFHALAIDCLKKQEAFCKTDNFEKDFKLENIRYCLSCPKSQKDFMEECFVGAGIVEPEDLSYRLVCVTEVEASAYHCLSLDRIQSKIVHDQEYFVCDIGHSSFGMAKIQADTTEFLSTVNLVSEEPGQGSMNLENNFRRYLNENMSDLNLNQHLIDILVEKFVDEIKYTFSVTHVGITEEEEIETGMEKKEEASNNDNEEYDEDEDYGDDEDETSISDLGVGEKEEEIPNISDLQDIRGNPVKISWTDLDMHVFSPYIKYITDYIVQKNEDNKGEAKIYLSGNYSSDARFYDELTTVNNRKFESFLAFVDETNGIDVVSLGAVSFGLRSPNLQTPFFRPKSRITEEDEKRIKKNLKKEKPIDFIVGIDFGTTFSGCSYADCRGADIHDNIPIKTLKTGWPGGDKICFGKTPTLIMYDEKMRVKYWGQAAKQQVDSNPDLTLLGNFKLFLSPKSVANYYGVGNEDIKRLGHENSFSNTASIEDSIRPVDKRKRYRMKKDHDYDTIDAVDIISDYLRVFNQHAIKKILNTELCQGNGKNFRLLNLDIKKGYNFRYVLTVPAMWSASAKETMAQASIDAGIITKDELHNLFIITEPEAAALHYIKEYSGSIRDPYDPRAEFAFVVCDAGGGTVDLATFKLEFECDDKPMIFPVGEGSGDTCGSSYLDSKFKDYLLQFYKDMDISVDLSDTNFNFVMDNFSNQIKVKFGSNSGRDGYTDIKLPTERLIAHVPETEKAKKYILKSSNTELRIMDSVMREEIFDPIVQNILDLIDKQIKQAEDIDIKIKSIVMIGGFSSNPYLQERVTYHYKSKYKVNIPPKGVAAISDGAVSYGLNPRMVSTKLADQSLALEVQAPFETKNENKNKEVLGPNGEKFARNRLEYFVKKMDYLHGDAYHRTVSVNYPQNVLIAIFSCDFKQEDEADDKNWRYVSKKHNKIMEETIELPEVKEIKEGTNIQFDIFLRMDHIGVTVVIECVDPFINRKIEEMSEYKQRSLKIERKCNFVVFRNKKPLIQYSLTKSQFVFGSS